VGIFSNSVRRLVGKDALKLENPFEQLLGYLFGNPFEKISRVEDYSAGTASGTNDTRLLLLLMRMMTMMLLMMKMTRTMLLLLLLLTLHVTLLLLMMK
jgi:hypothetical protein